MFIFSESQFTHLIKLINFGFIFLVLLASFYFHSFRDHIWVEIILIVIPTFCLFSVYWNSPQNSRYQTLFLLVSAIFVSFLPFLEGLQDRQRLYMICISYASLTLLCLLGTDFIYKSVKNISNYDTSRSQK